MDPASGWHSALLRVEIRIRFHTSSWGTSFRLGVLASNRVATEEERRASRATSEQITSPSSHRVTGTQTLFISTFEGNVLLFFKAINSVIISLFFL